MKPSRGVPRLCVLDLSQSSLLCGSLADVWMNYVLATPTCPCSNIGLIFATRDFVKSREEMRGVFLLKSSRRRLLSISKCVWRSTANERWPLELDGVLERTREKLLSTW
jgi:hypothetical protein